MKEVIVKCIKCKREYSPNEIIYTCKSCNSLLEIHVKHVDISRETFKGRDFYLWRYKELMPIIDYSKIVTLREGGTPLTRAKNLENHFKIKELYIKNEGLNPTGSFKDRGMTIGVSKALELGVKAVACASTGNTSASLAAYAAKAGIKCYVLIPSKKIAIGKLAQAILHGARVISIRGNFDKALKIVREICSKHNIYLLNSINPWRLEGQKSIGFEIVEQLNYDVPDVVIVPVGNSGNIYAIWKGFKEFYEHGLIEKLPRMIGIQAKGASPIVEAIKNNRDEIIPVKNPETIATAIRIGNPVNAPRAIKAIKESGGYAEAVTDSEIIEAQKLLARKEGIGVEPASAASIAGLKKLLEEGIIDRDERVVCIVTGHALKDPEVIFRMYEKPIEVNAKVEEVEKYL